LTFFKKSHHSTDNRRGASIIGADAKIKGDLQIKSNLDVYGEFSGSINSKNTISVEKTGIIEGEIVSKKLIVAGQFAGTAHCDEIKILEYGKVSGQITYQILAIAEGGSFEGECRHKESAKGRAISTINISTVGVLADSSKGLGDRAEELMGVAEQPLYSEPYRIGSEPDRLH
jgi:cytoskeletal protein CcmA (bactofilin family)